MLELFGIAKNHEMSGLQAPNVLWGKGFLFCSAAQVPLLARSNARMHEAASLKPLDCSLCVHIATAEVL